MKKINILMIMLITSFLFKACEKENIENNTSTNNGGNKQASIQSEMEMSELEIDINNFLEKMEGEEEGSLPLDEAVYYLEAGFNYRYAHPEDEQEFGCDMEDTSFVSIEIGEDDRCRYYQLGQTFDDIYNQMDDIFGEINSESKALHIVDVKLVEIEAGYSLRLISSWNYKDLLEELLEDDWRWGLQAGNCSGNYDGYDATDAIRTRYLLDGGNITASGIWTYLNTTSTYTALDPIMSYSSGTYNSYLYNSWHPIMGPQNCLSDQTCNYLLDLLPTAIDKVIYAEGISNQICKRLLGSEVNLNISPEMEFHTLSLVHGYFQEGRIASAYTDFLSN